MTSILKLRHGDCVSLYLHGNYVTGRICIDGGGQVMLANDVYSSNESAFPTRDERFGYRLLRWIGNVSFGKGKYGHNIDSVKIIEEDELTYETSDTLTRDGNEYKVLGRVGSIHFLSKENELYEAQQEFFTRQQLDELGYVKNIEYPVYTRKELESMTTQQILAELNRRKVSAEESTD